MSKKVIIALAIMVLALLGLSACTPTCDAGSLLPPELESPDWADVVDGSAAILEWSYPDTCEPDQYEIILAKNINFSPIAHSQLVPGDTLTWTPPALDIAEEYYWRVRAKVGSTNGPWSTMLDSFFTLPLCDAADLVAPSLSSPDFGGIFDRAYDSLEWSWPLSTCIPESYRVEVSEGSPAFTATTWNGGTGNPSTRWGFGSTPPAATQFWWRITAYSDGAYGPTSQAKMFWTDPVCPAVSLVPPVMTSPLDDEVVTILNPIFSWNYPVPGCTPEGFHLWVYDTPDMSSVALEANNPTISARAMQAGVALDDCGEYYWQVAAISEGIEGPPSDLNRFVLDSGAGCDCAAGLTPVPVQRFPFPYEILPDTDAHLSWYNPGGCLPDGAAVQIATEVDFSDMVETTLPGEFVVAYDPPDLEPATQYRWKVAYYVDDGGPVIGDLTSWRSFFTGPECASLAEVAAPDLMAPEDEATVDTLIPQLHYHPGAPGCLPDGYRINLQTDPAFGGTNLLGETPIPATVVLPDSELLNCTWYYWKVEGIQDGGYGPESETWSFFVNVDGSCLPPGIPARAVKNNFCRVGTYPQYHEALWTFETGDPALAIARNPFTTYLQLMVIDEKTMQPLEPMIICWSVLEAFKPGWDPAEEDQEAKHDFADLPIVSPPPTPTPTPVPYCSATMDYNNCIAAGGKPGKTNTGYYCDCP